MVNKTILLMAVVAASASFSTTVLAEDKPKGLGIGLGVVNEWSEYQDAPDDDEGAVELFLTYEGERIHIQREQIAYDVFAMDDIRFSIIGESNGDGFEAGDRRIFAGMAERDFSVELGAQVSFKVAGGNLNFAALKDISDAHDGEVVKLSYDQSFQLGNWTLSPEIGVTRYLSLIHI